MFKFQEDGVETKEWCVKKYDRWWIPDKFSYQPATGMWQPFHWLRVRVQETPENVDMSTIEENTSIHTTSSSSSGQAPTTIIKSAINK